MKIAVLGATGGVGKHFLNKALKDGHEIRALVRNPDKIVACENLTIIKGDVTNINDVRQLIEGVDIVVSTLGNVKGVRIMQKAANTILEIAAEQTIQPKCIFVSSIGCGGSSWLIAKILTLIAGRKGWLDYEHADKRIRNERTVPYVLIRPSALKERPGRGKYRIFQGDGTLARPITKEDVAEFLIDAISSNKWNGQGGFQISGLK